MKQWINIEERMPGDLDPVLISIVSDEIVHTRIMILASWIADESRWADLCEDVDPEIGGNVVTHWMPLPNHPE